MNQIEGADELLPEVLQYCIEKNRKLDISKIQREFLIGYPRAARIVGQMVEMGVARELDDFSKELITDED